MDLNDCYKKNFIKRTRIDKEKIRSLVEMSDATEKIVKSVKLDKEKISVYFSLAYDSLRELLEAICILKGYKVTSHVCLGELLETLISNFNFKEFDRMGYARNGVNYYGTRINFNQGKELINTMFKMKKELYEEYLKKEI